MCSLFTGATSTYWELLNNPEQEATIFGNRARSATDANVLRRKGHLKEQDYLIDYMRRMHETHTCEEVRSTPFIRPHNVTVWQQTVKLRSSRQLGNSLSALFKEAALGMYICC